MYLLNYLHSSAEDKQYLYRFTGSPYLLNGLSATLLMRRMDGHVFDDFKRVHLTLINYSSIHVILLSAYRKETLTNEPIVGKSLQCHSNEKGCQVHVKLVKSMLY
jgi:hypothetical protein